LFSRNRNVEINRNTDTENPGQPAAEGMMIEDSPQQ
jgi:hypothetical protein